MKRRSLRLPRVETHDDWVDESWTVDCLCGVNFDDGKEMVDCDKCRVWVHTRCSGYVKSDKSFVCDRCKGRNSRSSRNNYSVETEVAQLLVDLPNKDFKRGRVNSINAPSRKPGKVLYTEVCTEKKVHAHGVPGGDPSLFAGLSSVFSPQLWKCTGYMPKKFNFQYKEFPSLDEKETEEVERRNINEDTAGVLVSLLKDSAMVSPLGSSKQVEGLVEDGTTGKRANIEHIKSGGNKESSFAKSAVEKDPRLPQAAVVDSLKHKKKDRDTSKDHRERNRSGRHEKGKYSKKKARISSTTASTILKDVKQFQFYEDRGPKVVKVYTESSKSGDSKHLVSDKHLSNGPGISTNNDRKHAAADVHDVETKKFDLSRCCTNRDGRLKEDSTGDQREFKIENSHKVNQVVGGLLDSPNVNGGGSAQRIMEFQKERPEVEHLVVASPEPIDSKTIQGLIGDARCFVPNAGVKTGADKNRDVLNVHHSPSSEEKLEGLKLSALIEVPAAINLTEEARTSDLVISGSEITDQMQDGVKSTAGDDYRKDDSCADGCRSELGMPNGSGVRDGSSGHQSGSDGSLGGRKSSSQLKTCSKYVEGVCKSGARAYSSDPNHLKVLASKSSSETYKSSASASHSLRDVPSSTTSSKHGGILNDYLGDRRDAGSSAGVKDEGRIERSKKMTKDIPKSSISPVSKVSQSSRFSHASVPNGRSSDPKQSSLHASPKVLAPSATAVSGFEESTNSLRNVGASNAHNKDLGPGLLDKSEKTSHPDSQPSSKVNAFQKQPPASSNPLAALRDEQLALLLHQELNSSPRVPRVPRMRHAGSLPQLTSPTAASMLTKRVSPSPNHRRQYSEITTDDHAKGKVESGIPKNLPRKNKPPASTATTSSGLSSSTEANEQKVSSTRNSPRHTSDGDSGAVGRPTPLTLPGLIAKIMSKGERMTLKELCDTVLPHWPHLRKNNGERYAYSIHSQGVLDCLRNHSEWACLVDRGPKESGKDGAVSALDVSNEAKKVERLSLSSNRGRQYSEITTEDLAKGEVESGIPTDLPRKNKPPALTATTSSGLSSSTEVNEQKVSFTRNSPSDGDSGAVGRPTPLTLPGLIAKIMSKGERMTLKGLCDTVLPHWPHLRKNNGERYAYSSHSQGVLDCLRNRSEWARLVDRGPKTSARKKRRKPDVNSSGTESEDDDTRERTAKDGRSKSLESHRHRDEFPKGKRNARKRRRLSLHDVCIKENMRRHMAEVVSDDGDDSLSNSSGDSYR